MTEVSVTASGTEGLEPGTVCWVCGSQELRLVKKGNALEEVSASSFQITDSDYGRTADIWACDQCGFLMCPGFESVLEFYEEMGDGEYEDTRDQRSIQARRLLAQLQKHKPSGRIIDIGAGSGILVEAALAAGYEAEGVEPSRSLQKAAQDRALPVHLGVLTEAGVTPPYDAACLIDVIEHVPNPIEVLMQIHDVLDDDGVLMLVTPDVRSVAARLLSWKWWHYRIAHIGYFDRKTIELALKAAGYDVIEFNRPTWYFPASYLSERLSAYLPRALKFKLSGALGNVTVPLNLFDSMCLVARKIPSKQTQDEGP